MSSAPINENVDLFFSWQGSNKIGMGTHVRVVDCVFQKKMNHEMCIPIYKNVGLHTETLLRVRVKDLASFTKRVEETADVEMPLSVAKTMQFRAGYFTQTKGDINTLTRNLDGAWEREIEIRFLREDLPVTLDDQETLKAGGRYRVMFFLDGNFVRAKLISEGNSDGEKDAVKNPAAAAAAAAAPTPAVAKVKGGVKDPGPAPTPAPAAAAAAAPTLAVAKVKGVVKDPGPAPTPAPAAAAAAAPTPAVAKTDIEVVHELGYDILFPIASDVYNHIGVHNETAIDNASHFRTILKLAIEKMGPAKLKEIADLNREKAVYLTNKTFLVGLSKDGIAECMQAFLTGFFKKVDPLQASNIRAASIEVAEIVAETVAEVEESVMKHPVVK